MSTWVGTDGNFVYNLDHFAEIGIERRQDGIFLIRAWRQPSAIAADGTRYPQGDAVTLAELMTPEDLDAAFAFLRDQICRADFQRMGAE